MDFFHKQALKNKSHRFEWLHLKSDGNSFPVEVSLTSIVYHGKQLFHTVWRDITDRKKAEQQKTILLWPVRVI